MPDQEIVIKGLKKIANAIVDGYICEPDQAVNTIADTLALLKEQEPRVMTLEDVKAFGWDYCYLEEERLPGNEYRSICGDYALTCITWPYISSMRIQHGDDSYGKKWRCWSAKPTDEQRRAVKWE